MAAGSETRCGYEMPGPALHCSGCGDGVGQIGQVLAIGGAAVVVVELAEWVFARVWWILGGTAVAFTIAVWIVWRLMRWADLREARYAAEHPFLVTREAPAAVTSAGRPALGFRDLHIHLDGQPTAEQVQVIRQALNGGTSPS